MNMSVGCDGDQTIVATFCAIHLGLLRLDHSDQSRRKHASHGGRRIEQHHHVERIAVLGEGRRNEAELVREGESFCQNVGELECSQVGIIVVLVTATSRCFDDHIKVFGFRIEGLQLCKITHDRSPTKVCEYVCG